MLPWLVLDVETYGVLRPEQAAWEVARTWRPDRRWTPETIGKRFEEAAGKIEQRAALTDAARIVAIATATPEGARVWHSLGAAAPQYVHGVPVVSLGDERAMLADFRTWLDSAADCETVLAGFNAKAFDFPRLRHSYIRAGLRLPAPLSRPDQPVCDLMELYCRRFSVSRQPMVSLAEVCERLGLDSHKGVVDGGQVGELVEAGAVDVLARYAVLDVELEARLFRMMAGEVGE